MVCTNCGTSGEFTTNVVDTDERWGKPLTYHRCTECSVQFHLEGPKDMEAWYKNGHYNEYVSQIPTKVIPWALVRNHRWRAESQIEWLMALPWIGSVRTVLDVGAQTGQLVDVLREHGFDAAGYDTDFYAAMQAGGSVTTNSDALHKHYDLITCSHVLEHVERPIEFLNALKADYVFIEVPQHGDYVHPYIFSTEAMRKTVELAGFTVQVLGVAENNFIRLIAEPVQFVYNI